MNSFDTIQGTEYSCTSDTGILAMKKSALDYHTQYLGNSAKSSVTPSQLELMKIDYNTSKKKYDNSPCGKNPERDNCISYQQQIEAMQSNIVYLNNTKDVQGANVLKNKLNDLNKLFESSKCGDKIGEFKTEQVVKIADSFSEMDKARIEAESKYKAKQRVFFGALILISAVLVITMFGKKGT